MADSGLRRLLDHFGRSTAVREGYVTRRGLLTRRGRVWLAREGWHRSC
jgi:hypothetical protein